MQESISTHGILSEPVSCVSCSAWRELRKEQPCRIEGSPTTHYVIIGGGRLRSEMLPSQRQDARLPAARSACSVFRVASRWPFFLTRKIGFPGCRTPASPLFHPPCHAAASTGLDPTCRYREWTNKRLYLLNKAGCRPDCSRRRRRTGRESRATPRRRFDHVSADRKRASRSMILSPIVARRSPSTRTCILCNALFRVSESLLAIEFRVHPCVNRSRQLCTVDWE